MTSIFTAQVNERIGRWGWSILFVLTAAAFVMRFYRLDILPPGLFYDEAFNGLDSWANFQPSSQDWPVFLTGNQGREALYVWLMALLHRANGLSVWTFRAMPAACGSLLTPAGMAAGATFYTQLYWQVNAPPSANYTAFAHLLRRNEAGDLVWLAGADRPPGDGSCPTTEWLPGEVVIDELQFALPADIPAGDLFVAVGFYTPEDQRRLAVPGNPDSQVLIGPLSTAP